jgi:hypothetical protein
VLGLSVYVSWTHNGLSCVIVRCSPRNGCTVDNRDEDYRGLTSDLRLSNEFIRTISRDLKVAAMNLLEHRRLSRTLLPPFESKTRLDLFRDELPELLLDTNCFISVHYYTTIHLELEILRGQAQ